MPMQRVAERWVGLVLGGWLVPAGLLGCAAADPSRSEPGLARWGEATKAPAAATAAAPAPTTAAPETELAPLVVDLLATAQELTASEQYEAALALLEPVADSGIANPVTAARIGLLRDLGRRAEALSLLRTLVHEVGPTAVHPGLLFEWAELAWLEQRPDEAQGALRILQEHHAVQPWTVAHAAELTGLQRELTRGGTPQRLRVRDLLADLRGHPDPSRRLWSLQRLLAAAGDADDPVAVELRGRAVAIAAGDSEPSLRALALRSAEVHPDELLLLCAAGGADPAPLVRLAAVQRSRRLPDDQALPLLWEWCQQEVDGDVFVSIHAALAGRVADAPPLPDEAREVLEARARVLQQWRARWPAGPTVGNGTTGSVR